MWFFSGAIAITPVSSNRFTLWIEALLLEFAFFLKVILEFIAILIIAIALFRVIQRYVRHRPHQPYPSQIFQPSVRLDLGLSLALSLEFLLAADVVGTAVSPNWDAIAKLAAITGIRTFLNFFLHREVQELQEFSSNSVEVEHP